MDVVETCLPYRDATKIFLPIFDLEKIACFSVCNMSVIFLLDIGIFSSNMNRTAHGNSPQSHPIHLISSLKFGGKNPVTWLQSRNGAVCDQTVASS
jgi:hypothetical protein